MQDQSLGELESLFLALSDKTRLRLLTLMAHGPVAVGLLAEQLHESQPKVSRHLAYLRNAGVVSTERDGKYIYYRIETPDDARARYVLAAVMDSLGETALKNGRPPRTKPVRQKPVEEPRYEPVDVEDIEEEPIPVQVSRDESEELEVFLL